MTQAAPAKLCRKCKEKEARHNIRSDHFCSECFCQFVTTKTVKRLEVLNRDKRNLHNGRPNGSKTFYAGLSFGTSSSALVDIMDQITMSRLSRGKDASFALHVIHIDTDLQCPDAGSASSITASPPEAELRLDRWRTRYPRFTFERVPIVQVLALDTIDWAALQPSDSTTEQRAARPPKTVQDLRSLLANLPSETSRRDIFDLLVRRLLIARATASWNTEEDAQPTGTPTTGSAISKCDALLLGYSTTALAERTLVETAKGRGFALPWLINDGPVAVVDDDDDDGAGGRSLPLYYPVRELFRNELVQYTKACQPPLTEGDLLLPVEVKGPAAAVVSHRDLSIEEVLTRYFAEVEVNYPSVVANVVRTTAKLERHGHDEAAVPLNAARGEGPRLTGCRVCGMPLDEAGNERWKGEIGRVDGPEGRPRTGRAQLCYGCDRSIHG